jgi:hypothetical protein
MWDTICDAAAGRSEQPRLRLLGAGNVNDVDLNEALGVFREIELVDIDGEAVERGVTRQGLRSDRRIVVRGGTDFRSGALERRSFDVVASCCALSQLIDGAVRTIGPQHPDVVEHLLRRRDDHLADLEAGVRPGGSAVLVTDFVSSDTAPALLRRSDLSNEEVASLVAERNFFSGCNPFVLRDRLEALPTVTQVRWKPPWVWRMAPGRSYAVAALIARTDPRLDPSRDRGQPR